MAGHKVASGLADANVAKEYALASWALFLYEYCITFDEEVTNIWRTRGSRLLKVLWVFNRYTFFLSFTPTLLLSFVPLSPDQCRMFVKFPAAMQIILNASADCTLLLRTYAVYACQRWVLVLLLPLVFIEAAVESWAVTMGVPAELPPGVAGCILTGNPADGDRFALYWIGQLVFPTLALGMTVGRIVFLRRAGLSKGSITDILLRDGVIYFAVIFLANLANIISVATAAQSIQQINAPFSEMITTVMICRLILNLRTDMRLGNTTNDHRVSESHRATRRRPLEKAAVSGSERSPTFFDSQPGAISSASAVTGYEWGTEFRSASVEILLDSVEGASEEHEGVDIA